MDFVDQVDQGTTEMACLYSKVFGALAGGSDVMAVESPVDFLCYVCGVSSIYSNFWRANLGERKAGCRLTLHACGFASYDNVVSGLSHGSLAWRTWNKAARQTKV